MRQIQIAAVLATALLPTMGHAAGYQFTSFSYPGAFGTVFTGIDNTNRITGYANFAANPQGIFITSAGSLGAITPPGTVYAVPSCINAKGGIVGTAFDGTNLVMFQDNVSGFGVIPAGLPSQTISGINSSLNIVGTTQTDSGATAVYAQINGVYEILIDSSKCSYTTSGAINDNNVVVGGCALSAGGQIGFMYAKKKFTYFQPPAGSRFIQPAAINDAGTIAGSYTDSSGYSHGFVLKGTTFTSVDYPGAGVTNTQINGINNAGKIVGTYDAPAQTAFSATPQ